MQTFSPIRMPIHVGLDYAFVVVGLVAPWAFGYQAQLGATVYTLALAAFGLGLNVITDYPGGALKLLPFSWHRLVEWAAPPPFIGVPWLFFAEAGAMPYVLSALGLGIVANAALTRPTRPGSSGAA